MLSSRHSAPRVLFAFWCLLLAVGLSSLGYAQGRAVHGYRRTGDRSAPPRTVTADYMATNYPISRSLRQSVSRRGIVSALFALRPKVLVVSMFELEALAWLDQYEPSLYGYNITVPGLSPAFDQVHCTARGDVCQVTTGEGEINAAATMNALFLSDKFDWRQTYFLIAGVGGISPHQGTLGTAAFARYAIQVAQQYALDRKDAPAEWNYTYWNYNTKEPDQYPLLTYGTEVFALNAALAERAYNVSKTQAESKLNDTADARAYRARFDFAPANESPKVILGDVTTSDLYFAGVTLATQFEQVVTTLTNGSAIYATTAQEDNATLEALVRAQRAGRADYSRAILLRTGSDFERAPPGLTEYEAFEYPQGGFGPASANVFIAGLPVVQDILTNWEGAFKHGVPHQTGFYGDIWQTLSLPLGQAPVL
ncbi:hypothetical protein OC834_003720 [Tilletia horrida]|nr:hypothetical protein OC834_003720 [Tilletia horrida]KAK0559260.1 hypothetical protein OC844_004536 [Tilletia horrida]